MRIVYKLFGAIMVTSGIGLLVFAFLMVNALDRGFIEYLNRKDELAARELMERLQDEVRDQGSLQHLIQQRGLWRRLVENHPSDSDPGNLHFRPDYPLPHHDGPPPNRGEHRQPPPPGRGERPPLRKGEHRPPRDSRPHERGRRPPPPAEPGSLLDRTTLYDRNQEAIFGRPDRSRTPQPIILKGKILGYLAVDPVKSITATRDQDFMAGQVKRLFGLALVLIALGSLASIILARHLVSGVSNLAEAARKLSEGDSKVRVEETGSDEIGMLVRDFNHLARTLQANEKARKRWTAEISHELRTPLSVLLGEIEALRDGVRPVNNENLESLHCEVKHLSRLVDDLYQLSLSDLGSVTYKMKALDPVKLTVRAAERFRSRFEEAGLELEISEIETGTVVKADAQRFVQLLNNLLENACRYTNVDGTVRVCWRIDGSNWVLTVEDSPPGLAQEHLPFLFDRLWRADRARSRAKGGAGLGLALCVNIARAHNGQLTARTSPLGGLAVSFRIPLVR